MTKRDFLVLILLAVIGLCAVYVWPTRYRMIDTPVETERSGTQMRVDRITGRIDRRQGDGPWVEYITPPEYDVRYDSETGRAVGKVLQLGDDIKKMNEVAKKTTEH